MKNKLIVFEGIDGSGKSLLCRSLVKELKRKKINAVCYEDIENKNHGFNLIKPFIKSETPISASLYFYIASAIYKSQIIKNLLKKNWVVCDRYIFSTLVYHQLRGANIKDLPPYKKLGIIEPDYYFLITVPEKIRAERLMGRALNNPDDLKKKTKGSLFDKTENGYKKFKPIIIDNSSSVKESTEKILSIIKK